MERLKLSHMQPLAQRILMCYGVYGLLKDEVGDYIEHHLKLAGANHTLFAPQAIEAIAVRSRGFPRLINNLATHALICGCAKKAEIIDEDIIFTASIGAGL